MKLLALGTAVALWSASPFLTAVAQETTPPEDQAGDARQETDLPRSGVAPDRPMESTPLKYELSPEKLEYVERAREELEAFREEIQAHRAHLPPGSEPSEVDKIERQWRTLKEQWQWLKQTRGANWDTAREQFEILLSDVKEEWREIRRNS